MAKVETVADILRKHDEELSALKSKHEAERGIAAELPAGIVAPVLHPRTKGMSNVWGDFAVSWGSWTLEYASGGIKALDILRQLEAAGWKPAETWLAKYGNYRAGVYAFTPEVHGRDTLTSRQEAGPAWITADTFGRGCSKFHAYYSTPSGKVCEVSVEVSLPVGVWGRREESRGDWRYTSASFRYPEAWDALAGVRVLESRGFLDHSTPCKSLEGRLVFAQHGDSVPTPAQLLAVLMGEGK